MTRNVTDAALVLSVIAGRDDLDETTLNVPMDDYAAAIDEARDFRVGLEENLLELPMRWQPLS